MPQATVPAGAQQTHAESSREGVTLARSSDAGPPTSHEERRRAIEALLSILADVEAVRVGLTPAGEIERIQVLAEGAIPPLELKRRIRSALLAAYGLDVDLRLISVAGSADPEARVRLRQIAYEQEGFRVAAHVEVDWRGQTFRGVSRDADTAGGRIMAAGRAALKALEQIAQGRVAFRLEALDDVWSFDRKVTVASVRAVSEAARLHLVGCARIEEDPRHSAAQAVLAAVNRSLTRLLEDRGRATEEGLVAAPAANDLRDGLRAPRYALNGE